MSGSAVRRTSGTDGVAPTAVTRRRSHDRPGWQPVVAWVDHGMIRPEGRSRRGPQIRRRHSQVRLLFPVGSRQSALRARARRGDIGLRRPTSRDFVPWRFLDAWQLSVPKASLLQASKNLRRTGNRSAVVYGRTSVGRRPEALPTSPQHNCDDCDGENSAWAVRLRRFLLSSFHTALCESALGLFCSHTPRFSGPSQQRLFLRHPSLAQASEISSFV